ncbi:hypothetical protein [Oceanobacillus iheyensis HTE831]|uniref:Uncharacterized protein n=1 Tax=Oceanobacillus iheyensis (strain DSM 14371 / CIP 107618 / JCM 11309 / KCTC 3954 / HTE831) TaxID=221109 RepID=Q8CUP4_OCEIH|nr:hypothetical protein [Oceanobacillus iheyensis]BAC13019.1 hypothetical protein [Oceanobacillus iheyensis HTE831]
MIDIPYFLFVIYLLGILFVLCISVVHWIRREFEILSSLGIILSLLLPLMTFLFSIYRLEGTNEIVYIWNQLRNANGWAIVIVFGHLFLLVWMIIGIQMKEVYQWTKGLISRIQNKWKQRTNHSQREISEK